MLYSLPDSFRSHINRLREHGFARSVGVLAGGSAFGQALTVLVLPLLTRLYTPEDFSALAIFASLLGMIASIACLRYEIAIPIPQQDQEAVNLLGVALLGATVIATLTALAVALFQADIVVLLQHPKVAAVLWMLPIGVLFYGFYAAFQYWATRRKKFTLISGTRLTQAFSAIGSQLALGLMGIAPAGLVVGQVANGGAGFLHLGRECLRNDRELLREVNARSMRAAAASYIRFPTYSVIEALANSAALLAPMLIIAAANPGVEAGQLSLATRVMLAPMTLIGAAVAQVFLAHAAEKHRNGRLRQFVKSTVTGMVRVAIVPFMLMALLSPWAFPLLFGPEWARAGVLAAWLMPAVLLQLLASPVSMTLHVLSKQRVAMLLQLFGLLLRVGGVWAVATYAKNYASEAYAISGVIFYLVYIAVIFRVSGSHSQKMESQ